MMITRELTKEEKLLIKECFLCEHPFGCIYLPAIEFTTADDTFYIPVDFAVVQALCERTPAPYECYNVTRKKVDIDILKVKMVQIEGTSVVRITLK